MGKILAICISEKKGTQKKPIESARLVEEWGIEGDAHVGKRLKHFERKVRT